MRRFLTTYETTRLHVLEVACDTLWQNLYARVFNK